MTDVLNRNGHHPASLSQPEHGTSTSTQSLESVTLSEANGKPVPQSPLPPSAAALSPPNSSSTQSPAVAKPIPQRGGRARSLSNESSTGPNGTPPQRRSSWFSNISSKFSVSPSSTAHQVASPPPKSDTDADDVTPLPKITPNKNAVLPHAARPTGDAPYIPAPPRSGQPGFLGVFRRLSSSSTAIGPGSRASHGLVERRTLNVDHNRERCRLNELNQAKLRRVAFCVDIEIAPMPKYLDEDSPSKSSTEKSDRLRMAEKSEGLALKEPKAIDTQEDKAAAPKAMDENSPKESKKEDAPAINGKKEESTPRAVDESKPEKDISRKREKRKKSESDRKAKKEQKRREAMEKGAIPMEIHLDSDSSTEDGPTPARSPRRQVTPTTNPGRIYRRCCQLRETDILTKITGQLPKTTDGYVDGVIEKLDLTGYYLSLPDLVTLGDFLAVVPFREVHMENCGLTDEGMRVILAGLLAARKLGVKHRRSTIRPADLAPQGGVVERLILKNNKIGIEGWKHICLFIHMCRSIKCLDLSNLHFPVVMEPAKASFGHLPHLHSHVQSASPPLDISLLLSKCLANRLAGPELELLNLGGVGLTSNQLECVMDGILKSGVSRLGLSSNNLDAVGLEHVARYLRNAKCEGLDLGGNDLRSHLEIITNTLDSNHSLWALSLANCNLNPASLCKLLPKLVKLTNFKFFDLSHNHALFDTEPSAISLLRR